MDRLKVEVPLIFAIEGVELQSMKNVQAAEPEGIASELSEAKYLLGRVTNLFNTII